MGEQATLTLRLRILFARGAALLCVAAAALTSVECAAQDAPLGGKLYMSVFKRMPPDALKSARQILVVDMDTGAYQEIGAEGIGPRVSPDGKQIAYWSFGGENESFRAWIKDLDRNDEPRFLSYGHVAGWVKDGTELILNDGHRPEGAPRWLYTNYRIDASGGNRREIQLNLPREAQVVDCTPDGKWLLVYGIKRSQLFLQAADGGEPKRVSLAAHRTFSGRFSPDGKKVAYVASGKPDHVVTVNRDGSGWQQVYRGEELTDSDDVCWSPDGKHLAIVLFDWTLENGRRIMRSEDDHNYRVLIVDTDGKNPRPLVLEGLSISEISDLDWK